MADGVYDLAIVGCGMIGAAAARHAAKAGKRVVLVGPPERPRDEWGELSVFAAHYDEGRITRKTDPDPIWAELASRSIDRYPEIAAESGVEFFVEAGHLAVGPVGSSTLRDRAANAAALGVETELLADNGVLEGRFPYLRFPEGSTGIFEPRDSGYISARGLVRAQVLAAQRHGCHLEPEVVLAVERCEREGSMTLKLESGAIVAASRVLVAAGSFCNFQYLLPAESDAEPAPKLDMTPCTTQTVSFVLSEAEAQSLAGMPSVIYKGEDYWAYMLPPILYPDGEVRLKLGGSRSYPGRRELETEEDVVAWYRSGGDSEATAVMSEILHSIVPGLSPLRVRSDACATCQTPTGQAYIGMMSPGVFVATGGCGFAAKSSDEIGRLGAAAALAGGWDPEESVLRRETFAPRLLAAAAPSAA